MFKLVNSNRFLLEFSNDKTSFLHLATIHQNTHEFMCFQCVNKYHWACGKTYIEEIIGGTPQFIEDDQLAEGLYQFLLYNKILFIDKPMVPDSDWYERKH